MGTITSETAVQQRAYELFLERGGEHGNDQDDWFRAETELRSSTVSGKRKKKSGAKSIKTGWKN